MKSFFILAGIVMMMLTGCGSEDGSYSSSSNSVQDASSGIVIEADSTINEPEGLAGLNNLPPVPSFPQ